MKDKPKEKAPRTNHPIIVGVLVTILILLLAASVAFCWSALVGQPDWAAMSDKEMGFQLIAIALVTNFFLLFMAAVIVAYAVRKMTLPVLVILIAIAGAVDLKISFSITGLLEEIETRAQEDAY